MLKIYVLTKRTLIFSILFILVTYILATGNLYAKITIMPLGDSITFDQNRNDTRPIGERTAYRQPLWLDLIGAGYNVDFVGGQVGGQDADPSFDTDNEGHPGFDADEIRDNIDSWLTATANDPTQGPVNVILLHIGTNDLSPTPTAQSPSAVASEIEEIFNAIDNYNGGNGAKIWVMLALIINRAPTTPPEPPNTTEITDTTTLNTLIQSLANTRIAAGDKIIVVNMENKLVYSIDQTAPYSGDMWDDLHPNISGYDKMATTWFDEGLSLILPFADAGPDQIESEGNIVTLDGEFSIVPQVQNSDFSASWEQVSGPVVTLSDPNSLSPTFTAPDVSDCSVLQFKLKIANTDDYITDEDITYVTVNDVAAPPGGTCNSTFAFEFEAEDGTFNVPPPPTLAIGNDANASAGEYIYDPNGYSGGTTTYDFEVTQADQYVVWGRVLAADSGSNSFFVTLDGPQSVWHIEDLSSDWQWDRVGNSSVQDPVIYSLSAGQHSLIIEGREVGTKLDKILITSCLTDSEPDADVDGVDLVNIINAGGADIESLANELGRVNCQQLTN